MFTTRGINERKYVFTTTTETSDKPIQFAAYWKITGGGEDLELKTDRKKKRVLCLDVFFFFRECDLYSIKYNILKYYSFGSKTRISGFIRVYSIQQNGRTKNKLNASLFFFIRPGFTIDQEIGKMNK